MANLHRTGRQEAARKRKRQRQSLQIAGAVIGIVVLIVASLMIVGGEDDVEPVVADVPEPNGEATWTVDEFTGGPRLAVDRTEHDEGSVAYEHEVQASFRLKNVGDEPLTLDEVSVNTLEGC